MQKPHSRPRGETGFRTRRFHSVTKVPGSGTSNRGGLLLILMKLNISELFISAQIAFRDVYLNLYSIDFDSFFSNKALSFSLDPLRSRHQEIRCAKGLWKER